MFNPYFNLILNSCLMVIAIWQLKDIIRQPDPALPGFDQITRRGKIIMFVTFCVVVLSFIKDVHNEYQIKNEADARHLSDSLNTKKVQTAIIKTSTDIGKALADYNLVIVKNADSTFKILRDSIKRIIINSSPEIDPLFGLYLYTVGQKGEAIVVKNINQNEDSIFVIFKALYNHAEEIYVHMIIVIPVTDKDNVNQLYNVYDNFSFGKDVSDLFATNTFSIRNRSGRIYFRIIGTYKNPKRDKKFRINDLYQYDLKTGYYVGSGNLLKDTIDRRLIKSDFVLKKFLKTGIVDHKAR